MPQSLFEACEDRLLVAAFEVDDAVGFQASLRERWREKVRTREAPEHLARCASGDPGGEKRRRRAVDRAVSSAGDLMQRTTREPAPRKP